MPLKYLDRRFFVSIMQHHLLCKINPPAMWVSNYFLLHTLNSLLVMPYLILSNTLVASYNPTCLIKHMEYPASQGQETSKEIILPHF